MTEQELSSASARDSVARNPSLLVVPHLYAENICVREIEFARRLTRFFEVYCLKWNDALHVDGSASLGRRWKQFRTALQAMFARQRLGWAGDGITYVQVPILQPILVRRVVGSGPAHALSRSFNGPVLERVISACGISHLLLATDTFGLPRAPSVRTFFDLVDWFPEENKSPEDLESVRTGLKSLASRVQTIFAVSEPLCEKLKADCGIDAVPLPNGADLQALRSFGPDRIEVLRRQLGLAGKFVIGYIGNHGPYTGVDFVVKVFEAVRQRIPNAALLVVGPADYWKSILVGKRSQGVVATGPIAPSEVGAYFNAIDLGLLAQEKTTGTEFAFQMKIVEYSACRKFVVSTPLRTWQLLQWPNVLLANLEVDAWVSAICRAKEARWSPTWDALTEPYDWRALARKLATVMLGPD